MGMGASFSCRWPKQLKPDEEAQPEDRFSSLPEPLLVHIVSFLPLVEVISLATVSKPWKHLWTMVPNLVFDPPYRIQKHISFVNQTLALRRSLKIVKFSLPVCYRQITASEIDRWIKFAIKSNVEVLELKVAVPSYSATSDYKLPEQLYSVSSLRSLRLNNTSVMPIGKIGWTSLKSLHMAGIIFSEEMLDNMMKGCPVLEYLELRAVYGFRRLQSNSLKELILSEYHYYSEDDEGDDPGLEISAPHLRIFKIYNYQGEKLPVLSSPPLVEAHICIDVSFCDHDNGDCLENHRRSLQLFQNLLHVKKLCICPGLIQVMSMWKANELPSPLLNCKHLDLNVGVSEWEIPGIANFLRSVPCLEILTIRLTRSPSGRYCFSCDSSDGDNYASLEKPIALNRLKHVLICKDKGRLNEFDLKLVQFVLKNANALEIMDVYHKKVVSEEEELVITSELFEEAEKVFTCPRSSHNALVLFDCSEDYGFAVSLRGRTVTGYVGRSEESWRRLPSLVPRSKLFGSLQQCFGSLG